MKALLNSSPFRRLLVACVTLAAIDRFVPSVVSRVEQNRYESDQLFRFENSDMFPLGPVVSYLREHPKGARPRVAFFGNSVVWGYYLRRSETLPAQFQRVEPSARVWNFGVNGFETASAYLVAKDIIDSVDALYVMYVGNSANPMLPDLIPVTADDVTQFSLHPPDLTEQRLEHSLRFWHLYDDSYRLQTGLFGMSTRQYLYLHKADLARRLAGRAGDEDGTPAVIPGVDQGVATLTADAHLSPSPPTEAHMQDLGQRMHFLWDFAVLARDHRKHLVFIDLDMPAHPRMLGGGDQGDLNRYFFPYVTFLRLTVPAALQFDGLHFSPLGAAATAAVLAREAPPFVKSAQP